MAMPLAVLFIYVGEIGYPDWKMWHSGSWFPNTWHGILLYILKWIGMGCLLVGVLQVTHLHTKIAKKWRELRAIQQDDKNSGEAQQSSKPPGSTASTCATGG
mmetsp:Transcript_56265/g.134094  ORF Transcript_56265/g.134094 Transcript_56265/m.134094 type:complete len:102 (+) Transcript_56265:491-796(+)